MRGEGRSAPGSCPLGALPAPPPPRLSRLRPLRGCPGSAPSVAVPAPPPPRVSRLRPPGWLSRLRPLHGSPGSYPLSGSAGEAGTGQLMVAVELADTAEGGRERTEVTKGFFQFIFTEMVQTLDSFLFKITALCTLQNISFLWNCPFF